VPIVTFVTDCGESGSGPVAVIVAPDAAWAGLNAALHVLPLTTADDASPVGEIETEIELPSVGNVPTTLNVSGTVSPATGERMAKREPLVWRAGAAFGWVLFFWSGMGATLGG
jgi:hypothetical protein